MSREAYSRERKRLRQQAKDMEGIMQINRAAQMRRELFPWEESAAIETARKLGQESNGTNTRPKGSENYLK